MGLYLRKSIRVGPMRFNLSAGGFGVSVGVKGLRFGSGPRGNYVHMGRHGVYYRATIPPPSAPGHVPKPALAGPEVPPGTHEALQEVESASATQVIDSSSAELLHELNEKRRRIRLWPFVLAATLIGMATTLASPARSWLAPITVVVGASAAYLAFRRDSLAKTVVLFYDLDPEMEQAYGVLHAAAQELAGCARAWHVEAQGRVLDGKYHAGASSLVRRRPAFIRRVEPPCVKANVETIAIGVGRQVLHFFPDRVLIYEANGVGAVSYRELDLTVKDTRFIEDGGCRQMPRSSITPGST